VIWIHHIGRGHGPGEVVEVPVDVGLDAGGDVGVARGGGLVALAGDGEDRLALGRGRKGVGRGVVVLDVNLDLGHRV
jgi:hypothetical protein